MRAPPAQCVRSARTAASANHKLGRSVETKPDKDKALMLTVFELQEQVLITVMKTAATGMPGQELTTSVINASV